MKPVGPRTDVSSVLAAAAMASCASAPAPAPSPLRVPLAPVSAPVVPAVADHGGRPLAGSAALVHASASRAAPLSIVSAQPLVFDAPFGEGEDRHRGVRAASALVRLGDGYLVAQDDSNFAASWRGSSVTPLRLFVGTSGDTFSTARGNKPHKPDLEMGATVSIGGSEAAVLFGSGSTPARMRAVWVTTAHAVHSADLSSLYAAAQTRLGIGADALNLEGAAAVGDRVVFFQRGNGAGGVNASFAIAQRTLEAALVDGQPIAASALFDVRRHDLGTLDGCALGFSDAAPLPDGRILVVAAAEASPNTYDDGAVAGSVLMVLEATGELVGRVRVPDGPQGPYKLEGVAVDRVEGGIAYVRAVEDADDPARPSTALTLALVLPKS